MTMHDSQLQSLPRQGHMVRSFPPDMPAVWAEAIQRLPDEQFKFALNAAHDTFPHNANLHLWKKKDHVTCILCGDDHQNLVHVLNSCRVARDLRRYNERHDAVLALLYEVVKEHLPDTTSSTVDLISSEYSLPCHIVATDLRPDIIYWDETTKKVSLIELTVWFDSLFEGVPHWTNSTLFEGVIKRKEDRYQELLDTFQDAGYTASLVTVEVGSRGIPNPTGFLKLKTNLGLSRSTLVNLMVTASRQAITGSFKIWCMRNQK